MQSIGIKGIGYYVPENVFTNFDFEKIIDTSDEWKNENWYSRKKICFKGPSNF